ncbi:unnamed protein product, partial [Schistosoma margrebowiei]
MNEFLSRVDNWSVGNGLILNPSKCQTVNLSMRHERNLNTILKSHNACASGDCLINKVLKVQKCEILRVISSTNRQQSSNIKSVEITVITIKWKEFRATSGELLLYSGHEEENAPRTQAVALMLSKQAQNALIGWESHGPRIIKASFKTKKEGITMNIIQCYAPTNDYNEDAKDQFYNRLQSIVKKCQTKDLTILMGDFNAKVGTDNTGYEDIMGRHGLGERNENGERFANLCAFNKLVIGGTIFPHKRIHKTTWTSPDHTTQNQIDHICINKTFRRTKRGADIASDHHLLVAKMKLKLKKHWTT